jgi:hypothetical protein
VNQSTSTSGSAGLWRRATGGDVEGAPRVVGIDAESAANVVVPEYGEEGAATVVVTEGGEEATWTKAEEDPLDALVSEPWTAPASKGKGKDVEGVGRRPLDRDAIGTEGYHGAGQGDRALPLPAPIATSSCALSPRPPSRSVG